MLKLKLQYFGHLMQRTDSLEKTLMLGKIEGRRRRDVWLGSITTTTTITEDEMVGWYHWLDRSEFEQASGVGDGQGSLERCSLRCRKGLDTTEWLNWTEFCLSKEKLLVTVSFSSIPKGDLAQVAHLSQDNSLGQKISIINSYLFICLKCFFLIIILLIYHSLSHSMKLLPLFPPVLRYNWHKELYKFKMYNIWHLLWNGSINKLS